MKQIIKAFLLPIFFLCPILLFANNGDTTVVITSPILNADASTNYDTLVILPTTKTYRKIYLIYTLNSHPCPAGSMYCHQWDYIGNVIIKSPHGDTVQLAKIITPFATSGWSRFPAPPVWSEDYIFDVTDFAPLLKDSITINSALGVGSPGYGIQTKFIFIEGTPDRNIMGIAPIYSYAPRTYGSATNPIDSKFPVVSKTAPAATVSTAFRFIVTGHGSDTFQCCEFASHYYKLFLNGASILQQDIWRNDCGLNELYPQGGTWSFNRANWCPGSNVLPYYDSLPGITAGTNYNVNVTFEPYTVTNPSGVYDASASVIYYGPINKSLDVSIEDIISPSSDPRHFRENPANNLPTIHIHNSGSTSISNVTFQYGVVDSALQSFTWSGSLAPLRDTIINLPPSNSIAYMSSNSQSGIFPFIVTITGVNGITDADQTNDTMRSQFIVAPNWPDTIQIKMLTSNLAADGIHLNANPADAGWYITNVNGDTLFSRINTNYSTTYTDTIILPGSGFYNFSINTSANCAGLHWWLYDQAVTGYAPGYLLIKKLNGSNLAMLGYTYATNTTPSGLLNYGEHDDFGCGYSQYFYVSDAANAGVKKINKPSTLTLYPNPANDQIFIDFDNIDIKNSSISIINIFGQTVYSENINSQNLKINCRAFAPGVYIVSLHTSDGLNHFGKVVISK